MNDSRFLRQLGIYNPADRPNDSVTFVGVGGIGSFAAFAVAKLGVPSITLIDPDTVEEHNQPNQFPNTSYLAEPKVRAMGEIISWEQPEDGSYEALPYRCTDTGWEDAEGHAQDSFALSGVVVSGLDSMSSRVSVWEHVKLNPRVGLYLDARLSGQLIVLYAVNPINLDDIDAYETTLHSDAEGDDVSCTARGIIDVGMMVGSVIARAVRRHFMDGPVDRITVINQETLAITKGGWVE